MKIEEYHEKKKEIENRAQKEIKRLVCEYALSEDNNSIQVGDMVTDHIGTIKVTSIKVYLDFNRPSCIYRGLQYTKQGKPFKSGEERDVYQFNIKQSNL